MSLRRGFALVGRDRELAALLTALRQHPQVVMVSGEAGVGKSRLIYEAAAALDGSGVRILTGFCHPLREPLPFGPVLEALRGAGDFLPDAGGLSAQAGALSALLPDIAPLLPVAPEIPADPRAARFQLMGAVRTVLGALGPAVLVVEDLHWVDDATCDLLLLLARDLPRNLTMVLTCRPEDLPRATPVLGTAYHPPIDTLCTEIRLAPLTLRDVRELAEPVLGKRATPRVCRTLFERSGGLPLVAEEDLLTLTDPTRSAHHAAPETDDVTRLKSAPVPRALREAVIARVSRLSEPARALACAAAVLERDATRPTLFAVAGLDPPQADDALIEAIDAAVLCDRDPALYGLRHPLARQALYDAVPGPEREALHSRALRALHAQSPVPLVQIAHHTRALGDAAGWLRVAQIAADNAVALGDDGIATTLLQDILAAPDLDADLRARNALALARIADKTIDYSDSAALLRRVLASPHLTTATRGEIRLTLGLVLINHAADRAGLRELEQAADELAEHPELAIRALGALAQHNDNTPEQAQTWMARAEQVLRDSTDEKAWASVNATKLTLMVKLGDRDVWELADRLPRHTGDREVLRQTARALYNVGTFAIELGHDDRATRLLRESRELGRLTRWPVVECYARTYLLQLDYLAGRWDTLESRFAALLAEFPDMATVAMERAQILGNLAAARGQWVQALEHLRHAAELRQQSHSDTEQLRTVVALAHIHLAQGDPRAAWTAVSPCLELLRRSAAWARAGELVPVAVQAALASGHDDTARQLTAEAVRNLREKDAPAATAELHLAQGLIACHDNHVDQAVEHHDRARLIFQAIGRPRHTARATEHCAHARIRVDPRQAADELAQAADIYTRLGAVTDAARCHKTLRNLGLTRPSPRGRRGYGADLSPRESQVAQLLAYGASNQDIAHALGISSRTVEHHVAKTLKKLATTREAIRGPEAGSSPTS